MKRIFEFLVFLFLRFSLSLRYRIVVKGKEKLPKKGGILFLANHPAEIDPCILLAALWYPFRLRPVAIDFLFRKTFIRNLLSLTRALPVPNFDNSSNSYKRSQIDKTYKNIYNILGKGENLLIYPAGGLKSSGDEVIGGASGVHTILEARPETTIVLVRTLGLWGSSFSRALTGKSPDILTAFLNGFKVLLRNFIFFAPRRKVVVECCSAPCDFPRHAERRELNRYLEQWFNAGGPEPLTLVSYSIFRKTYPSIKEKQEVEQVPLGNVQDGTKQLVNEELVRLSRVPVSEITPDSHLSLDLGLDSLDIAQLIVALKENFGIGQVQSSDLTTVASVYAFASGLKTSKNGEEEESTLRTDWKEEKKRPEALYPDGETLIETFLKTCERMDGFLACADQISGEVSYKRLKIAVILLADAIRKLPGERIGIMMPASVAVNAVIFATILAGKVPVMVNWTLGDRNIKSIVNQSDIKLTLSSWSFLDRLDNVELDGLNDRLVLLEDIRRNFSLMDKCKAFLRARKKTPSLLRTFGVDKLSTNDTAVILFTSGTESFPKGVPLSHKNIIENHKAAQTLVSLHKEDVLLGSLPPFHSFGLSVTGLFPLLIGLRAAYYPNPTDGKRMALAIERWDVTLICLAPTFLKNLLRAAAPKQIRSLKLVVTGAEKTAAELFEKLSDLNKSARLIEGYGITECGPILTLNPPDHPPCGVGLPLPGVVLKVVEPETFKPLPEGENGLILARGPNVFSGYLDPKLEPPFVELDQNKWYQTGDLGYLNGQGYLMLSGRLKRFVKIGGEMVSLGSIEEALQQSIVKKWHLESDKPFLAVCALEEEGKKSEMHLFVTLDLSVDEANLMLRGSGMSNLIKIRSIKKIPFIPLLGTGKIDYRRLERRLK